MVKLTKKQMISRLKSEYNRKRGTEEAKQIETKLKKMNLAGVERFYKKMKGNVYYKIV